MIVFNSPSYIKLCTLKSLNNHDVQGVIVHHHFTFNQKTNLIIHTSLYIIIVHHHCTSSSPLYRHHYTSLNIIKRPTCSQSKHLLPHRSTQLRQTCPRPAPHLGRLKQMLGEKMKIINKTKKRNNNDNETGFEEFLTRYVKEPVSKDVHL